MLATFLLSKAGNSEFGFLGPVEMTAQFVISRVSALPTSLEMFTHLGNLIVLSSQNFCCEAV